MEDGIAALLELQDKDLRLSNLRKQVEAVPQQKAEVEKDLAECEQQIEAAKSKVFAVEKKIKDVEMDIGSLKEKKNQLLQRSSSVKKNEEYRAILNECSQLDEEVRKLEDRELELWEELEAAKNERSDTEKRAAAAKSRIQTTLGDLDTKQQNCQAQVDKVAGERAELAEKVPDELLTQYERLRRKSAGSARLVAPLVDGSCGNCRLKATPQVRTMVARGTGVVNCENCGALLYAEE